MCNELTKFVHSPSALIYQDNYNKKINQTGTSYTQFLSRN